MHITVVAYGTWGDVYPGIALARALAEAGYRARLIVTRDFAEWVEPAGVDFHLLPIEEHRVTQGVSSRSNPLSAQLAIHRQVAPRLVEAGRDLLAATADTDVLLVNEWLLAAASGIAETRRLKLIHMGMQPRIKTRQMPICTMPPLPADWPLAGTYNALTYELALYVRWWTYLRAANALRASPLNLKPLSARSYRDLLLRTPSVTLVSPRVVPRPPDWPAHHHLAGYVFYDDESWRPPTELLDFLGEGEPPVYVGFGSVHDRRPESATRVILQGLEGSRMRAVLHRGWGGLGEAELPDSVYRLEYAPHRWLFPQMAAVVHHAGAGTTAAALRAGVPSVPIPHSGDQPFWARRLHELGAATRPLARGRLEAGALAERISTAVGDARLPQRARELSAEIAAETAANRITSVIGEILLQAAPD
jgi:UDP:flavonoid glycosyltransferase YjiC (YdhE family)